MLMLFRSVRASVVDDFNTFYPIHDLIDLLWGAVDLAGSSAADSHWSVLVGCLSLLWHSHRLECELTIIILE